MIWNWNKHKRLPNIKIVSFAFINKRNNQSNIIGDASILSLTKPIN